MDNARGVACPLLLHPEAPAYDEAIRRFQGCPTIAATRGGRLYLGWYSGGTREPHIENYNLLIYSDDEGVTWSRPLLVIPSDGEHMIHALDIQLFLDPAGRLHVVWVQNNARHLEGEPPVCPGKPLAVVDGVIFDDFRHAMWETVCENPDADEPCFSEPRYLDIGFLRCKPTFLSSGRWILFNYDQESDRYGYSLSDDGGLSYRHLYGARKLATPFDEAMAYERRDGSIRMLARSTLGELAESISCDGGEHFGEARPSGIVSPNSRFFVSRTPSGRILLVRNDDPHERCRMTLSLSEDDGATWAYTACIDGRTSLSYPDVDFYGGRIYLTYDRERTGAREILFASFTEEDIMGGTLPTPSVVSKP